MCVVSRFGVYYGAKRTEYQQSGGSESRAKDGAREKKTIQGGKGGQRVWFGETAGNVNIMRAKEKFELHILLLVRIGSDISDKQRRAEYFWFHCEEAGDGRGIMS